jgi:hypothetical protein
VRAALAILGRALEFADADEAEEIRGLREELKAELG